MYFYRYHQKLPIETPILDTKAIHGLAEPEEYILPDPHPLWSPSNYDSFNLSKGLDVKDKSVIILFIFTMIYFFYIFLCLI